MKFRYGALAVVIVGAMAKTAAAEVMTVQQLDEMLQSGNEAAEIAATAYFQGVADGMLAMEAMRRNGRINDQEFCGLLDGTSQAAHPAYQTKNVVEAWKNEGRSMETIAPDMILGFLSAQYGC